MTLRLRQMFVLALVSLLTFSLATALGGDTARAATRSQAPALVQQAQAAIPATLVVAWTTPKRHIAMRFNYAQRGEWYRYGATGPSTWDCSGLVQAAYRKAGIYLPRTTYDIIKSSKLSRTYSPRWGDIVFTSTGHMEMYVKPGWMHGAHKSGTRIGYKAIYKSGPGWPKYYRVRGAG